MRASPLNDVWLPRSTPYLLKGKRFYHLRSGNSATCSTRDEPLDAYLVNNIDQAGFVAVDDDVPPTDAAYQDVLRKARERNIPILKTSDLKLARQLFHGSTKTKLNDLFGHPRSSESAKQFTVQEGRDTDGCPTLTFGENDIECRNSDEGNELLDHEILLRDPIVRRFAQTLDDDWKHFREIIRTNPLRIVNTRWKIKDVLGDYRSNAWDFVGPTTCVREWDEAKFNEDFKTPSDHVKPTKAVRAALFVFYITNEKSVKDRLPPASASPSIESATETDEEIPGDNNETMTPSPADLDNIKLIQKIILDEETNKKAIEVQQLQIEQMADCGHWLIHQHIQRGQLVTDLLQTVVAPRRAKAASNQGNSPETDQVWFNARLSEGAIKTIPYQDIEFDAANLIGRGDSGSVYRVTWNDRDVALKVFYERSLFLREMRSIYSVGPSDNIIQLEGTTCNPLTKEFEMVMEYASNGSLHDYWKNRPNLRWPFKVDMALQLAHALQCIHSNGFVHDNLDCSNILVRQNGSIALSGFSMSSKSTSDRFDDQQPNTELSRDVYSFGVLLWEISALRPAFDNADNSMVWQSITEGKRETELPENTPEEYHSLWDQCWNRESSILPNITEIVKKLSDLADGFDDRDRQWDNSMTIVDVSNSSMTVVNARSRDLDPTDQGALSKVFEQLKRLGSYIIPIDDLKIEKYFYKRGAFADVHRGIWNGKQVAVKQQIDDITATIREVKVLNSVTTHRNIVNFYGISQNHLHHPYIVMELAISSLQEYVCEPNYKLNVLQSQRIDMCMGIAYGLAHLHAANIVHCDLHSANILINVDRNPVIADFGLSRTVSEAEIFSSTNMYGRMAYTAPERIINRPPPSFDQSQDIFSLGVIIRQVLSGTNPSAGYARINPSRLEPIRDCPEELVALYQQCTSDTPSARPGAQQVVHQLINIKLRYQKSEYQGFKIMFDDNFRFGVDIINRLDFGVDAVDLETLGIRGASEKTITDTATSERRTIITTDTDFYLQNNPFGILILMGGYLEEDGRYATLRRMRKQEKQNIVHVLFRNYFGEIERLQKSGETMMAVLSKGVGGEVKWTFRKFTDPELIRFLAKKEAKMEILERSKTQKGSK